MQSKTKMTELLTRNALYDLVWSEPMKTISERFGISDVALKKICVRATIPTPDRGYWAKKDAGKQTFQSEFPARPPGMSDQILIGKTDHSNWGWNKEYLLGPIGPPPEFPEPIEEVRTRIAADVGRVSVPRKVGNWHSAIDRVLKEDDKRQEKQLNTPYPMSWEKPLFDSPFERRRLRILNSLFFAVAKINGKSSVHGREAREIRICFFQQYLPLSLDTPKRSRGHSGFSTSADKSRDMKLCLSILKGSGSEQTIVTWQDEDHQTLESRMTDIAIQVILTAEIQYRDGAFRQYEWRVQRKAELEEEERKRKLEAERAEKERLKRIEQGRVDRLLRDAASFHQARTIRKYVEAIRLAQPPESSPSHEEFEQWSQWALTQADRIDPVIGKRFLLAMHDEDST
jgi:hypothetical protein